MRLPLLILTAMVLDAATSAAFRRPATDTCLDAATSAALRRPATDTCFAPLSWSPSGGASGGLDAATSAATVLVDAAKVAAATAVVTIIAPPTVSAGDYLCFEVKVSGGIEVNVLVEIGGISLPVVVRPSGTFGSYIACVLIPAGVSGMKVDVSAMSAGSNVATATVGIV